MSIQGRNKTKIVATIGPASAPPEVLRKMIDAGVDVVRINFSHGSYDDHKKVIDEVHKINETSLNNVAILADLQGPKIRIGEMEEGVVLKEGDKVSIKSSSDKETGNGKTLYINYLDFAKDVSVGENVLIDDGKIVLEVNKTNKEDHVHLTVVNGGKLSSKKGINLPNTKVSLPCLTEKDRKDLLFALDQNVHWVALSFVRSSDDIIELKSLIAEQGRRTRIIAKIEKPEAIENIDSIIEHSDGLMVARGDLGIEVPIEYVPMYQKMMVKKCMSHSKPVIIATQMMEGMIENLNPSRAEVNDVANSVLDGADAVMLSGETSVGKYPIRVVEKMAKIAFETEKYEELYNKELPSILKNNRFITDSVCFSACKMAERTNAKAIITMTHSGYTAFKISSYRPNANIFVFTSNRGILCMLNLVWGVRGFYYNKFESTDDTISDLKNFLKEKGFMKSGELVINVASMPITDRGMSNMLKLSEVV